MLKRLTGLLAPFLALCIVTGCWSKREMNELAIVVGIGVDKIDSQIKVTFQVVDPGEVAPKKSSGGRSPITVYESKGDTYLEAMRKITTKSPRQMYPSHLRVLVIGESIAREGLSEILDIFTRDWEHRSDFIALVSKGSPAGEILKVLTPIDKIPANELYSSLETAEKKWAPVSVVTLDKLINNMTETGKESVLSAVILKGPADKGQERNNIDQIKPETYLQYAGLSVFKKDKLLGWMNESESKGYNYITDNIHSTVHKAACPGGGIAVLDLIRSKTNVKARMKNGKPVILISLRSEENIGEMRCVMDLRKRENIRYLEKSVADDIRRRMQDSIGRARDLGSDIFGFGKKVYQKYPAYWKQAKEEWTSVFRELPIEYDIQVNIRQLGRSNNSFINRLED
ncbi:Ger(x)C family spore germination protein [Paenibacillus chitinolyticus]|uniref:Ger(x)C family spore germination protein n=1 Tax=Paenibacillus chitinolyticus TaxID=79263 RepID=UPI0035DB8448